MAQGIPEEIIDEVRQQSDLVDLVGDYLKLERRGKNMIGLCPFHSEKTPSFTVSAEKQLYHCFGCGASGNVFGLIMEMEKLSFPEAVRFLARRAGITIPERKREPNARDLLKEKLHNLNLVAARYYHYQLIKRPGGRKALDYLLKRGISRETIERFMLGYAPSHWTGLFDFACSKGASPELLVKAGLVSPGREQGYYDRFRNRVVFPICTISGKVAGFGGRILDEKGKSGPKYLNSPETEIFSKGTMLYGLNLAREESRRLKTVVVMEGYTDVITAYQAGFKNVVASLGTALTYEQSRLLRNQAENVITAYDADSAGAAATWRGLAILQSTGCLVRVTEMPVGSDPDSMIRKQGRAAFDAVLNNAVPLIEYRMARLKERYDLQTDRGRVRYTDELMPFLATAVDRVEQDYYLKQAAEELGVEESILRSELKKRMQKGSRSQVEGIGGSSAEVKTVNLRPAEKILISLMLQRKEIAELGRNLIKPEYLEDETIRQVVDLILSEQTKGDGISAEQLLDHLENEDLVRLISTAVTDPALQDLPPQTAKRMAEDSIDYLRRHWSARQQKEFKQKIKELEALGLDEEVDKLLREHRDLITNKDGDPYRLGKGGDFNG